MSKIENLNYNILLFDEISCTYCLIYSSSNIFDVIDIWNYYTKKYKNNLLKCVRELQIYGGDSSNE